MQWYNDVPFDDIYDVFSVHWLYDPWTYITVAILVCCSFNVFFLWRWLLRPCKQGSTKQHAPSLDHWKSWEVENMESHEVQQTFYREVMYYIKYRCAQTYTQIGPASTDTQLLRWAYKHLATDNVDRLKRLIDHAHDVRFRGNVYDTETITHDYMIVNEIVTDMADQAFQSSEKNTS